MKDCYIERCLQLMCQKKLLNVSFVNSFFLLTLNCLKLILKFTNQKAFECQFYGNIFSLKDCLKKRVSSVSVLNKACELWIQFFLKDIYDSQNFLVYLGPFIHQKKG